jgi:hypothetical protein
MRALSCLAALLAAASPLTARAGVVIDGALGGGGGSDSALFRLAATLPPDATISDRFVDVRPELSVTWIGEPGTRVALGYSGVLRSFATPANGRAFGSLVTVSGGTDLAAPFGVAAQASGALEHFDSIAAGYHSLGAALGPRVRLGGLELAVLGELQTLDSDTLSARALGGAAAVTWRTPLADVEGRVRWQTDQASWSQTSAELGLSTRLGALGGSVELAAGRATSGTWAEAEATLGVHAGGPWTVELRGRASREWDAAPMPSAWAANGLLLVRYTLASGAPGLHELVVESGSSSSDAPARGVRVVVRVRDGTRAVALVGDLDGWAPQGIPLARVGPGLFEAVVTPAPGRYEFRLRVANELVLPDGAAAYVDDGFGSRNAVLIVGTDGRGTVDLTVAQGAAALQ